MTDLTPQQFAIKWKKSQLKESAAYMEHFGDLCELLGHSKPAEADPTGEFFTYQRHVAKESGKKGFADVWLKGKFGLEYKSKGEDLDKAYRQLLQYHDNLFNPPLLIVCDFDRFEIRTKFNDTVSEMYVITVDDLIDGRSVTTVRRADGTRENFRLSPVEVLNACYSVEILIDANIPGRGAEIQILPSENGAEIPRAGQAGQPPNDEEREP